MRVARPGGSDRSYQLRHARVQIQGPHYRVCGISEPLGACSPWGLASLGHLKVELTPCRTSKGTLRCALDKPVPTPVLKKILKACLARTKQKVWAAQVCEDARVNNSSPLLKCRGRRDEVQGVIRMLRAVAAWFVTALVRWPALFASGGNAALRLAFGPVPLATRAAALLSLASAPDKTSMAVRSCDVVLATLARQ